MANQGVPDTRIACAAAVMDASRTRRPNHDTIRSHRKLQGGFIWDWVDQTMIRKDEQGRDYWAQGPDYDEDPFDR